MSSSRDVPSAESESSTSTSGSVSRSVSGVRNEWIAWMFLDLAGTTWLLRRTLASHFHSAILEAKHERCDLIRVRVAYRWRWRIWMVAEFHLTKYSSSEFGLDYLGTRLRFGSGMERG